MSEEVFKNKEDVFYEALDEPRDKDHEVTKMVMQGIEMIKKSNGHLSTSDIVNGLTTGVLNSFTRAANNRFSV